MKNKKSFTIFIVTVLISLLLATFLFIKDLRTEEVSTPPPNDPITSESVDWEVVEGNLYIVADIVLKNHLSEDEVLTMFFNVYDGDNAQLAIYMGSSYAFDIIDEKSIKIGFSDLALDEAIKDKIANVTIRTTFTTREKEPYFDYEFASLDIYTTEEIQSTYRVFLDLPETYRLYSGIAVLNYGDQRIMKRIAYLDEIEFVGVSFSEPSEEFKIISFDKIDVYRIGNLVREE